MFYLHLESVVENDENKKFNVYEQFSKTWPYWLPLPYLNSNEKTCTYSEDKSTPLYPKYFSISKECY